MATASTIRKFRNRTQQIAGRKSGHTEPSVKRTAGNGSHGFLNKTFRPFWAMRFRDYKEIEDSFFRSFTNLSRVYNLPHPQLDGAVYPQNVAEAFEYLQEHFKKAKSKTECLIVRDELNPATIVTIKKFDTGQTLYYIPVNGLWQIIQCKRLEPLSNMLLSVFAYLYQIVEIPFFRDHSCYLFYEYEMISDWIEEDEGEIDEEFIEQQRQDLVLMAVAGDRILNVIQQRATLEQLDNNLNVYCQSEICRKEVAELGRDFLKIYRDYPERSIFKNMQRDLFESEYLDYTHAGQYLGFYWSGNDTLNEQLFEVINNELQENSFTEEPTFIQFFNSPQESVGDDFDFEERIFSLLDRLCDLLIPYDNGEH